MRDDTRNMTKIFVALAAVAALGLVAVPAANAGCANAYLVASGQKRIVSNPNACADNGAYCYSGFGYPGDAPLSPGFDAVFWSMTTGNPAIGAGDDNGGFDSTNWVDIYFFPSVGYYRNPTIIPGTNWTQAGDGCVDNQGTDGTQCTCMGMFDEWNSVGYFALLADRKDALSNYDFQPWIPGDLRLAPVPPPQVVGSTPSGTGVDLTVTVPNSGAGLYLDPNCGPCAELRYQVYLAVVNSGVGSPADREADSVFQLAPGQDPSGTPVGISSLVNAACTDGQEVWLTTQLIFDSGFETFFVSGDTLPIDCGDPCPGSDDSDSDGDGVCDLNDLCPGTGDGEVGGAGCSEAQVDGDGDGVCDPGALTGGPFGCLGSDNCPNDSNPGQEDSDSDNIGDVCDACPGGDDDADTDGDGVADFCDDCPLDADDDSDGDGVCDSDDACPGGDDDVDTDGDGVADFCDDCPLDTDDDSDDDGVCDSDDACPGGDDVVDTDGDGVADFCDDCPLDDDDDSDGDGVCDSDDACPGGDR